MSKIQVDEETLRTGVDACTAFRKVIDQHVTRTPKTTGLDVGVTDPGPMNQSTMPSLSDSPSQTDPQLSYMK